MASGKLFGNSEGGRSALPTQFTVEAGGCGPQLRILLDFGRNTLRIVSIPKTDYLKSRCFGATLADIPLCNIVWQSGIVSLDCRARVLVAFFKKKRPEVVFKPYGESHASLGESISDYKRVEFGVQDPLLRFTLLFFVKLSIY